MDNLNKPIAKVSSQFKTLYHRYASGHIEVSDFERLRADMPQVSDENLWETMLENAPEGEPLPMPADMKQDVAANLRKAVFRRRLSAWVRYGVAACTLAAAAVSAGMLIWPGAHSRPAQELTAAIPAGSRSTMTLPDGTKVQLNSASELSFDWDTDNARIVRLRGEAYFDVAKDKDRPFRVMVSDIEVEVHGTSFNINAYNPNRIETSLISGSVSLGGHGLKGHTYQMSPGEKAVYNRADGAITIAPADVAASTAWLNGEMVFDKMPLREVIANIERSYGVSIELRRKELAGDTMTGSFRSEDINNVMSSLEKIYKFKYTIDKNHIVIY